jgi:hypothetical protein
VLIGGETTEDDAIRGPLAVGVTQEV